MKKTTAIATCLITFFYPAVALANTGDFGSALFYTLIWLGVFPLAFILGIIELFQFFDFVPKFIHFKKHGCFKKNKPLNTSFNVPLIVDFIFLLLIMYNDRELRDLSFYGIVFSLIAIVLMVIRIAISKSLRGIENGETNSTTNDPFSPDSENDQNP